MTQLEGTSAGLAEPSVTPGLDENFPLLDAALSFRQLPASGHLREIGDIVRDDLYSHNQGMAVYRAQYIIVTHSAEIGSGFFFVYDIVKKKGYRYSIETPGGNKHPGGIQILGDYLVVGIEPTEKIDTPSWLHFYDLRPLLEGKPPRLLSTPRIEQHTKGAAAVALAKIGDRYVLTVYGTSDGLIHFYLSNRARFDTPGLSFDMNPVLSFRARLDNGKDTGYDNMALVRNVDDTLFLIGLRGDEGTANTISDYADLWRINLQAPSQTLIETKHFYSDTSSEGMVGPHFRYGAGATVRDYRGELQIYCSPRSLIPVPLHPLSLLFNVFSYTGAW